MTAATATKGEFSDLIAKVESKLRLAEQRGELIIQCGSLPMRHFPYWAPGWIGDLIGRLIGQVQMFADRLEATIGMVRQLASEPGRPWTLVETGEQWVGQVGNPTDGMIGIMTPQQLGSSSWAGSAGPVFNATLPAQQNALGAFHGLAERIHKALTDAAVTIEDFWKKVATLAAKLATEFMFILLFRSRGYPGHYGHEMDHSQGWSFSGGTAIYLALQSLEQFTAKLIKAVRAFWSGMDATTGQLTQLAGDHNAFHGGNWPSPTINLTPA